MNFYGYFNNLENKHYGLEISNQEQGGEVDLLLGDNPCSLNVSSSQLFQPIKSRSLSINIVSKEWYFELYEPTSRGTSVKLFDYEYEPGYEGDVNHIIVGKTYFRGYLTPCSYAQDFVYLDEIELEAVDAVSTCKDFKWQNNNTYNSFFDILIGILKSAGYRGCMYVPKAYSHINTTEINKTVLNALYASSTNFLDDNEEKTPWTEYEVLEEICKFLGWSLCPDGDDVWLVDYRYEAAGSADYCIYEIQTGTEILSPTYSSPSIPTPITLDNMASGKSKIDIDDIYNKIEVSDSIYKIDEISPDIFDDDTHISITDEKDLGVSQSKWSTIRRRHFLWWEWEDEKEYLEGTDFQTICRIKPGLGWTHYYYRMSDGSLIGSSDDPLYEEGYFDSYTDSHPLQQAWIAGADSTHPERKIIKQINTQCCLLQHYAYVDESHPNNVPTSIDWTDILTFFVSGPTISFNGGDIIKRLEKKVLEYNVGETIQWRPSTGKSWITLKGSLFYQGNCSYKDDGKTKVLRTTNVDQGWYATAPIDKSMSNVPSDILLSGFDQRSESDPDYGKGFKLWKIGVHINGKSWTNFEYNSSGKIVDITPKWVNDPNEERYFYLSFNNNPDNENNETIPALKWIETVSNTTYKDQVGEDAYAIVIPSAAEVAANPTKYSGWDIPSFGKLKIEIFNPLLLPVETLQWLESAAAGQVGSFDGNSIPVIFCKDFEIGYVYTAPSVWWNNHDNTNDTDKVYIGYIDDDYVNDFDGLTCKLNTSLPDKPISRSYVATADGYLDTMTHKCANPIHGSVNKTQEYNIVDQYLDHHSERKIIYTRNMKGYHAPNEKFSKPGRVIDGVLEGELDGTFMIDSQSYDFRNDNNKITFIAF